MVKLLADSLIIWCFHNAYFKSIVFFIFMEISIVHWHDVHCADKKKKVSSCDLPLSLKPVIQNMLVSLNNQSKYKYACNPDIVILE